MERDFWHARWQQNQIGFHLGRVHPRLISHCDALPQPAGSRVLVPLCGKTVDMVWLAQRGHQVVGVELSELAAKAFVREQGFEAEVTQHGPFVRYRMPNIELLCGDFFALTQELLGPLDGYYDRAALVALPGHMRAAYVEQLQTLLPAGARGLLVSFDYAQEQMQGPPFAVPDEAVQALHGPAFELQPLGSYDILEQEPRFRAAGLTALSERVYALRRR